MWTSIHLPEFSQAAPSTITSKRPRRDNSRAPGKATQILPRIHSQEQSIYMLPAPSVNPAQKTLKILSPSPQDRKARQPLLKPSGNTISPLLPALPQALHSLPDAGTRRFKLPENPTRAYLDELLLVPPSGDNNRLVRLLCPGYFKSANADDETDGASAALPELPEWIKMCPACKGFKLGKCKAIRRLKKKENWRKHPLIENCQICNACGIRLNGNT